MNSLNQIKRIKIKLGLAKNTDTFFEVFGATSHQYVLDTPILTNELSNFENTYNITLPKAYKLFLTEIGNGGLEYKNSVVGNSGAGPDYGIFKLGHPFHFIVEPSSKYLEKEPFFNENTTVEKWEGIQDKMDDNISDEDYDKEIAEAYSGILNIGYSGCSGYLGIVINGKNKGRLVVTYDQIEYCPSFFEENNFLDWYENWLDRIISGEEIMKNDFISQSEKEKDIVTQFISNIDHEYWQFRRLNYLRSLKTLTNNSLNKLWKKYKSIEQIEQKICILNFLTKFDYLNSKEEISKCSKMNPLAFLRNIHLYAKEKTNDWANEINSIKTENSNNLEVMEYIKFVTELDLKNY
ncbi:hypothetical protein GCM10011344_44560 [Dokdonia pacifica]|uniref:SMI1 / KNR4 family (SUKH-1) n=1 Tax=Dokdonia pacifica TaxID=1627892 RepID=A0A239CP55_9FLAO|nr:SMI1/KNR4 family protein [Dokdonia pacifica]GGG38739.1 hypothetical protein GCM10011344_44560 [Dokdonia pacifica]SNS21274.1 SMI1 / KNR4 family (SUKH-1) [Dokdonia pacifica]